MEFYQKLNFIKNYLIILILGLCLNGDPKSAADNGMIHVLTEDMSVRPTYNYGKVLILTLAVRVGTPPATTWGTNTATIDGITYTIQGGTTLGDFASDTGTVFACPDPVTTGLPLTPGAGYEWRSFILNSSEGLGTKGFLRAMVVEAP